MSITNIDRYLSCNKLLAPAVIVAGLWTVASLNAADMPNACPVDGDTTATRSTQLPAPPLLPCAMVRPPCVLPPLIVITTCSMQSCFTVSMCPSIYLTDCFAEVTVT